VRDVLLFIAGLLVGLVLFTLYGVWLIKFIARVGIQASEEAVHEARKIVDRAKNPPDPS
jgi:hypothetical protein